MPEQPNLFSSDPHEHLSTDEEDDARALLALFSYRRVLDHQAIGLCVSHFKPLSSFFEADREQLQRFFAHHQHLRGYAHADFLTSPGGRDQAFRFSDRTLHHLASRDHGVLLTVNSGRFPARLRRSTYPCQWAFFYPTFLGEPRQLAVAIVGSRRSTRAQLDTAFAISRSVIEIGGTVVTGMASGADTAAFDAARSTPHQLVLVLGTGVRRVFPSENTGAVRSHLSGGGAVITEMPPDHAPNAESFVLRNRIIAALADIVVAVSGEYSSGTSHTIKFAHALGRQLLSADPSPSSGITRLVTELGGTQVEPEAWAKFLEQG